jgi:thiol:disulfide interchange protein
MSAQENKVTWTVSQKKTAKDKFEITFTARIAPGWHLYSQIETPDGPLPTVFEFEKSKDYKLVGKTSEPKSHETKEPMFDNQVVRSFDNEAVFRQVIQALTDKPFTVKGSVDGMACNETQCQKFSPPFDFNVKITGAQPEVAQQDTAAQASADSLPCKCDTATIISDFNKRTTPSSADPGMPVIKPAPPQKERTYWALFIAGFLGGLAALLTPCVFPMIPMTVSFFTKQSKTRAAGVRNAIVYSVSIIAIYIALGLSVTILFGADALNGLATNVWFNLAFFLLLVIFAISFLGAFEITLPAAFVNKMDAKSDKGGYIGIFFMAFTLGLVSFSCTGPIIGTLLVQAASSQALAGPFFGMLGFSLALALPFGLFAAFPGWLNSLPKSGGWLNSVKVVLGFLELALAMKFLSNADLVYDAMIITREVFLVVWIVIFALMGAYLMGWYRLPHDSGLKHVSVSRLMLAIITFAFTFYLIPGLWGAPLKLISGFPPPLDYTEMPGGFGGGNSGHSASGEDNAGLPAAMHKGPHGIPAFDDYYAALAYSKKVNKPIMLDFTGKACVNCRKMEEQVWSDPEVKKRLSEDFILVSLFFDKKNQLPVELQREVNWSGSKRRIKTVGDQWSYLQISKYHTATQPQYYIIDSDEVRYNDSTSYDPDIDKYIKWLDEGLANYRKRHAP